MIEELEKMLEYCKTLKFEETPDYEYLYKLIKTVFENTGMDYDYKYDWVSTEGVLTETSSRKIMTTKHSRHLLYRAKRAFAENNDNKIEVIDAVEIKEKNQQPKKTPSSGKGIIIEA